jgi:hypothetical protein
MGMEGVPDWFPPGWFTGVAVSKSGDVYVTGDVSNALYRFPKNVITDVVPTVVKQSANIGAALPAHYSLSQNYPNPFNPSTTIRFELPEAGHVALTVYNMSGQEVARLADESLGAGSYLAEWDGRDMSGELVSSGVYLYRLKAGEYTATRRMIMMK